MNINNLLSGFLGSTAQGGDQASGQGGGVAQAASGLMSNFPGGLAGGAAAGGVVAMLMGSKKARKIGGKALTYGGLAVVGGLAYKAWSDYKANQTNTAGAMSSPQAVPTPPADSGFDPAHAIDHQGNDLRLTLVRAMISAAKADGHIDASEHDRIAEQIDAMALASDEKAFLFDQMRAASDPIAIATLAKDEPQATEIFLASALAIDTDTPEERRYMDRLGDALRLPDALRVQLEDHANAAKQMG